MDISWAGECLSREIAFRADKAAHRSSSGARHFGKLESLFVGQQLQSPAGKAKVKKD
jgi:hypothetical protein